MPTINKIGLKIQPSDLEQNYYRLVNPSSPTFTTSSDFFPLPSGKIYRSNMLVTNNRSLIMVTNADNIEQYGQITRWYDNPHSLWNFAKSAEHFKIRTKDIDFNNVSVRKKVHKIYVTFKAGGYVSGVIVKYATNGSSNFNGTFSNTTYYNNVKGFDSYNAGSATSDWITVALSPSSSINNVHSMQLEFSFANAGRINKLQSASNSTTIILDTGANSSDDYYNGMPLYLYNDSTNADILKVTDYNGSSTSTNFATTVSPSINHTVITSNTLYDVGFIPAEFAINDISIVYRDKPAK